MQKVLARAGLGSRRAIEARIEKGEVLVNKIPAQLGTSVGSGDLIGLDQREFRVQAASPGHRTLIYHKPEGEVTTTSDPEGRRTVFDQLPRLKEGRWIAIGRLDLNTAGLLLLTTDGELANRMMHPSGGVDREYLCRVRGPVSEEQIQQLLDGVELDDGPARFSDIVPGEVTGSHAWYTA
ncbi:MAG: pseudouridine synthase, partial [Wenzhouxiangella sp.]